MVGAQAADLVRALILGLLLPATDDPDADREIFLALMTMDDDGLWRRVNKAIPAARATSWRAARADEFFQRDGNKVAWRRGVSMDERKSFQRRVFFRMSYDDRLTYCRRPEEIDGPDLIAWAKINAHLGTNVTSLPELVRELGERRFGHVPRVGDAFCGGGSIPFEAARIGCEAYGSDLNPVAALLTWGALNIVGGGEEVVARVSAAQRRVFDAVQQQVDAWGIERNEQGWVADAYLYCNEARDPNTGWVVPLAPSWVIATKTNVIARLVPDHANKRFDIEIVEGVSAAELAAAVVEGTASGGVRCPVERRALGRAGAATGHQLRRAARPAGAAPLGERRPRPAPGRRLQERLYCVRWVDPKTGTRHYRAPDDADLRREARVLELLRERFADWQAKGYIPSRMIEPGAKTDEPIRTRGWTHWHHLFNPRQLLVMACCRYSAEERESVESSLCSGWGRGWNHRMDGSPSRARECQTFSIRALKHCELRLCRRVINYEICFQTALHSMVCGGNTKLFYIWIPPTRLHLNYEKSL